MSALVLPIFRFLFEKMTFFFRYGLCRLEQENTGVIWRGKSNKYTTSDQQQAVLGREDVEPTYDLGVCRVSH